MHWARVQTSDGTIITGVVEDGMLHPKAALGSDKPAGDAVAMSDVSLLPPVQPGKFIGLWNNFHAAAERNGWTPPTHPLYFFKASTSLTGHDTDVEIPADVGRVLFEGELGIVIGTHCKNVNEAEAEEAIFGYTCVNDLTALQILTEDDSFPQWTRAKSYDGFGVVGPYIATGLNWQDLEVKVVVGTRERQSFPASDMIMSPAKIVSLLSKDMTLEPGDLIACGTSVGARPIKAGDRVEVVIEGIGGVAVTMQAAS